MTAALMVACFVLSAIFVLMPDKSNTASAAGTSVTVTVKDLMERHGVDYAVGPLTGKKYNAAGEEATNGDFNNPYGIPNENYYDASKYLHIVNNVLYGWKKGIKATDANQRINSDGSISGNAGPYIHASQDGCKYVIIVPDSVTAVGKSGNTYDVINSSSAYTDFGFYTGGLTLLSDNHWQPRERLGGIYFTPNSNLTTIEDGINKKKTNGSEGGGSYSAFGTCDNMRFCVLPSNNKFKTIGDYAFRGCSQMRDINIPACVTSLGDGAFYECGMPHLTLPSSIKTVGSNIFENSNNLRDIENHSSAINQSAFPARMNYYTGEDGSMLFAVGTIDGDIGTQAFYFCKNTRIEAGLHFAAGQDNSKDRWYAIGLAGLEDKKRTTIYDLPATVRANDTRRANILYDYLNPDGTGHKNTLSEDITGYDIADKACNGTWCGNIRIPHTVKVIGSDAFWFAQVQYVEIPAGVYIGSKAFSYNNQRTPTGAIGSEQLYYIHGKITTNGNVFDTESGTSNFRRRFIYETQALYNDLHTNRVFTTNSSALVSHSYEVPIKAVVDSSDGNVDIVEEEISGVFRYDNDYVTGTYKQGPADGGNGVYTITYTKRLSNLGFTYVKQENGSWANKSNDASALKSSPTIEGMTSTQWYEDNTYKVAKTAWGAYNGTKTIYTKKIGAPTVKEQTWTYGDKTNVSFKDALTLSDDYTAELVSYTDKSGNGGTRAVVEDAGSYVLRVQLADKWGKWNSDKAYCQQTYTVEIAQQEVDIGVPANLPQFVNASSRAAFGGTGEGASLRLYNDGWYPYEKTGDSPSRTVVVLNSFVRYQGVGQYITIDAQKSANAAYSVTPVTENSRLTADVSGEYLAVFNLNLPDSYNYIFTDAGKAENTSVLSKHGVVTQILNNGQQVKLTKTWYIVTQGNWLVDSSSTATGDALMAESFNLTTKTVGTDVIPSTVWSYEDTDIEVHVPKLAYGDEATKDTIKFTITYKDGAKETVITGNEPLAMSEMEKYINSAMPAGEYAVLITAPGTTVGDATYPAINERVTITVNPKEFEESKVEDIKAELTGKVFENKYVANTVFLYNAGEETDENSIAGKLAALQGTLNGEVNPSVRTRAVVADNYWKELFGDYYSDLDISFNLDRMQTREYFTEAQMQTMSSSRVPVNAGVYTVYYSLSAKNYMTVGGEQANDSERRQYFFTVVIYDEVEVPEIADGTYAGKGISANPSVPYSTYYRYDFEGQKYDTVTGDWYVTLTMSDPKLARWTGVDGNNSVKNITKTHTYAENAEEHKEILQLKYNINKATNSWQSAPQISGWNYDGFDVNVHKITSTQTFIDDNLTEYFRIGYNVTNEDDRQETVWVDLGNIGEYGVTLNGEAYFKLDGNGLIPKVVADLLNLLKPGDYFLASAIEGSDNVNAYTTDTRAYNNIHVNIATNTWSTPPNIVPWIWGRYSGTLNTITAEAVYPKAGGDYGVDDEGEAIFPEVHFAILYSDKTTVAGLGDFTSVTDEVADVLGKLPYGAYYLRYSLAGTDYFTAMTTNETQFLVYQATNTWATPPNVVNWNWSEYNKTTNLIKAIPQYDTANDGVYGGPVETVPEVKFTVLKAVTENDVISYVPAHADLVNFLAVNGVAEDKAATALGNLDAGTYYLVTSMEGRNNYSALNQTAVGYDFTDSAKNKTLAEAGVSFTVSPIANTWDEEPNVTGWDYKNFNITANFIEGKPHFPVTEDKQTINYSVYNSDKSVNISFTDINTVEAQLKALIVGNYTFEAVFGETGNYSAATKRGTFRVSQAQTNEWRTPVSITGWTYKAFADGNFTAGEDSFGSAIKYTVTDESNQPVTGYSNLTYDALKAKFKDGANALPAGTYTLTATNETNANYVSVQAARLSFRVEKADNEWVTEPSITGWTFGSTASDPVAGALVYENDKFDITGLYYEVERDGTEWKISSAGSATRPVNAGNYAYEVIASAKEGAEPNYKDNRYISYFTVSPLENEWTTDEAEATLTWVYGNANTTLSASDLANLAALKGTVSYVVKTAGGNSEPLDKDGLISYFTNPERGIGTYNVVATVSSDEHGNYTSLTATTSITIEKASFSWKTGTAPVISATWVWGSEDSRKIYTSPEVDGRVVVFNVSFRSPSGTSSFTQTFTEVKDGKSTSVQLREYLIAAARNAGTYTITATVEDPNYNTLTGSTELTITQASNVWEENAPVSEISAAYAKFTAQPVPVPKYGKGTVVYTDGNGAPIADLLNWLNGLSYGTHRFTTSVQETDNYAGLSSVTAVTVNQIAIDWTNKQDIKNSYDPFVWSESFSLGTVVIPYISGDEDKFVTYEVSYTSTTGTSLSNTYSYDSANEKSAAARVRDFLNGAAGRGAGTYTLRAVYNRNSDNYNTLAYNVTITVSRHAREWLTNIPESLVTGEYKKVTLNVPTVSGDSATVAVNVITSTGSTSITPAEGKTMQEALKEYLNGLPAGRYTVTFSVGQTQNYSAITANTTLVISSTVNGWEDETEPVGNIAITRGATGDVMTVPVALFGNDTLKIAIRNADGSLREEPSAANLNNRLRALPAGTYTVAFNVAPTGDYSGLSAETRIVVSKINNEWAQNKAPAASYNWSFTDPRNFAYPEAKYGQHTISYSIRDLSPSGTNSFDNLTEDAFETRLANLPVGVYRITSTVVYEGTDGDDYGPLSGETSVSISKVVDGWEKGKEPQETLVWTWHASNNPAFVPAEAETGAEVKFSVKKRDMPASEQMTASEVLAYLQTLDSGMYSIIATVGDGTTSEMLQGVTVLTINQVETVWNNASSLQTSVTWTYLSDKNVQIVVPVPSWGVAQIKVGDTSITPAEGKTMQEVLNEYLAGQGAGTFTVTATVDPGSDVNHTGVTHSVTLTVNKATNVWTKQPSKNVAWTYRAANNSKVEFVPKYNNVNTYFTVYIDGNQISDMKTVEGVQIPDVETALSRLNAGRYTVRAEVEETDNYYGLNTSVTLVISQSENGWKDGGVEIGSWTWDNYQVSADTRVTVEGWKVPVPLYGNVVNITVYRGAYEEIITSLTYNNGVVSDAEEQSLLARLRTLHAGTYRIRAVIPESTNYKGYGATDGSEDVTFAVRVADNEWTTAPAITNWVYGSDANAPTAVPRYGLEDDVRFTYYRVTSSGKQVVNVLDRAGDYEFEAYLPASPDGDYRALNSSRVSFKITKAELKEWQTTPSITPWVWNAFKADENLFLAAASTGGEATFTIYKKDADENIVNIEGLSGIRPNDVGVITDKTLISALKGLKAGTYYYVVNVTETGNYKAFVSDEKSLSIGTASNDWLIRPTIKGWAEYFPGDILPSAKAIYGDIALTITSDTEKNEDGTPKVYLSAVYYENGERTVTLNDLKSAKAGMYTLNAYVQASDGEYTELTDALPVEVFVGSFDRPVNHWTVLPAMDNWTWGDEHEDKPRGEAYWVTNYLYTYWKAEQVGSSYVKTERLGNICPENPGTYIVNIVVVHDGFEIIDYLEAEVRFTIFTRTNEWKTTPNIPSYSLGDGVGTPVAELLFDGDAEIQYKYKYKNQVDETAWDGVPTEPGEYTMIVTATAANCEPLVAYVDFTVSLSKNSWLDIPVIKDWSEEFDASDPTGIALFGNIVYTYATADGVKLDEKPQTEGSYIMYATVELDGYETLSAEYAFTITAAFDRTLLTIDIILAFVVSAVTVVVIVFAIRRYKENG